MGEGVHRHFITKKQLHILITIAAAVAVIFLLLAVVMIDEATALSSDTVTITATVQPVRQIVVDESLNIKQIASNTAENVTPQAFLGSYNGLPVELTDKVWQQYNQYLATGVLSKPGYYDSSALPRKTAATLKKTVFTLAKASYFVSLILI